MNMYRISSLILVLSLIVSCTSKKENINSDEEMGKQKAISVPVFNADSAYFFIEKQVSYGPRVPNTDAHNNAGDYIINTLKNNGLTVVEQKFEATTFDNQNLYLRNIIASYNPTAKKRILLSSHWDSRPFADKDDTRANEPILGANDGASGVGVLLEMARVISKDKTLEIGIDIILFDGEDWGNDTEFQPYAPLRDGLESWWCLGSQYWSKNKHEANYSAFYGILLDMVGGKNAKFFIEDYSRSYAPSIVDKVWGQASQLGYDRYFIRRPGGQIMDDHYFVNKNGKIPMIDIIPTDPTNGSFGEFHHTHDDNMSIISKETLDAVGTTLLNVIYKD
jgi:glutaminyl-peptide cyclotransferase